MYIYSHTHTNTHTHIYTSYIIWKKITKFENQLLVESKYKHCRATQGFNYMLKVCMCLYIYIYTNVLQILVMLSCLPVFV